MDTKQYLNQINRLDKMIQNKLSEIYQLKTMALSVTVSNEADRVQTSSDKDRLGSVVAKIVDLENEANRLVDDFIEKRRHIIKQVEGMDNIDYYNVLFMRYVSKMTFETIADKTNWSLRQIFKLHGEALKQFEKLYGSEYLTSVHKNA